MDPLVSFTNPIYNPLGKFWAETFTTNFEGVSAPGETDSQPVSVLT